MRDPLGLALDQPLGAGHPAAPDRFLEPDAAVLVRELRGDEGGAGLLARREVAGERALEQRNRLDDLVREIRRPGQLLDVGRIERVDRRCEEGVRLAPAALAQVLPPFLDAVENLGHAPILAYAIRGSLADRVGP
jgi:hypothetical protein